MIKIFSSEVCEQLNETPSKLFELEVRGSVAFSSSTGQL